MTGIAEGQPGNQDGGHNGDQEECSPRAQEELKAKLTVREYGVLKRVTYGHVTIIGHDSQKDKLNGAQEGAEVALS